MAELADGDLPDETDGTGVHNRLSRTDGSRKWTPLDTAKEVAGDNGDHSGAARGTPANSG